MKKNSTLIILLAGVAALAMGIFTLVSTKQNEKRYTESVPAIVTEYVEEEQRDTANDTWSTVYYPVFSYEVDGKTYTERYSQYYSKQETEIGGSVTLLYDPEDPTSFWVEGDNRGTFVSSWLIPVGALLIVYSGVTVLRKRRG